jgi:hypothetical protein
MPASGLEAQLLATSAAKHAELNPGARVILLVDRRSSTAGSRMQPLVLLIVPSNPWHALLPDAQVAEILDREPDRI